MRIKGFAVRTNVPLPPPSGPARLEFCLHAGLQALKNASTLKGEMERRLGFIIPGGWFLAPSPLGLELAGRGHFVLAARRRRVEQWFDLRDKIFDNLLRMQAYGFGRLKEDLDYVETLARTALTSAVEAYHWLADARLDLEPISVVLFDGREWGDIVSLVERAHILCHRLGDVVGGMFGCQIVYEDGIWYDECQASLLHIPYGYSIGFTARRFCTICGEDFGDCDHQRGEFYEMIVSRGADGLCSACGDSSCEHVPGTTVRALATTRMDDIDLHEVSFTPRPRDPLARITGREVSSSELERSLGRMPQPEELVLNHVCMGQCEGFRRWSGS